MSGPWSDRSAKVSHSSPTQQTSTMATIRYFIPEDGDVESHPNVFLAPKPRQAGAPPTLGSVRGAFPLPGRYHFRFKSPMVPGGDREKGGMAVWMDCVNDNEIIPTWQGTVVAKVTRVSIEEDDDDDDEAEFAAARAAAANHRPTPASTPSAPRRAPSSEPLLDVFDGGHAPRSAPNSAPSSAHSSTGNLLDVPAPAPSSGSSLLDMDTPIRNSGQTPHHDFLGMTAPATPSQPPYNGGVYHNGQGRPTPQQQQRLPQQTPQQNQMPGNSFDKFSSNQGPFGGLEWGK